jgi:long-subunit acyl-CoA synthetase (AMP-forming)
MDTTEHEEGRIYKVVVNQEARYSIWPADRDNPVGWRDVGKQRIKDEGPPPTHGGFAEPEDVALVLHTSGTPSRPKIVPLTQANICTLAHNI